MNDTFLFPGKKKKNQEESPMNLRGKFRAKPDSVHGVLKCGCLQGHGIKLSRVTQHWGNGVTSPPEETQTNPGTPATWTWEVLRKRDKTLGAPSWSASLV